MDVLLEETQGKKVFVVAGEVSGDALAAHVLRHHTCIEGVIGQNLKDIGAKEFLPIDVFQTLGFFSVLRRLPHFIHLFFKLRNHILSTNPDLVLLVDNAEFSLLLGKSLRKHGYKGRLVQLVAPSVWAWRRHRAKIIDTYFDQVLCILPFEPDYFKNGVYIGHPLMRALPTPTEQPRTSLIALFPGSRKKEIYLNLPLQLEATKGYEIAIALAHESHRPLVEKLAPGARIVAPQDRYALMQEAEFAVAKFGTVNLELAFFATPTILSYVVPWCEYILLRHLFRVILPHYSLVNRLAGKRIFPEYMAFFATKDNLRSEVEAFKKNPALRNWVATECKQMRNLLAF